MDGAPRFDAVLFDLLTGLLDSWSSWDRVAGGSGLGRRWRLRYLELCYGAGEYIEFSTLIEEAAADVGLPADRSAVLMDAWGSLEPWPEVSSVLSTLPVPEIGAVTNCSENLARVAAARVGVPLSPLVSAERAGAYKPDPRPYQLALSELDLDPSRVLFVAGSPSDISGATGVGMPVVWHNRAGLESPKGAEAVAVIDNLAALPNLMLAEMEST